jgi:hypothetical protein
MKRHGTKGATDDGREPAIKDLRKSVQRLRILTASMFALTIVLNLTPAAAEIKAKITGEDVVDESLTGADIQDRSLTGVEVAGGSIDGFNIELDTLVGGHVVDDSLTTLDVQDGSLTGADVQNFSLAGIDVAPSSISGGHLLDDNVTGSDIDESTLDSNDAHDFFNPHCDPHSGTLIHCAHDVVHRQRCRHRLLELRVQIGDRGRQGRWELPNQSRRRNDGRSTSRNLRRPAR